MNHVLRAIEQYVQKRLYAANQDLVQVVKVGYAKYAGYLLVTYEVRGRPGYDGYDDMSVPIEQIMIDSLNIAIENGE